MTQKVEALMCPNCGKLHADALWFLQDGSVACSEKCALRFYNRIDSCRSHLNPDAMPSSVLTGDEAQQAADEYGEVYYTAHGIVIPQTAGWEETYPTAI